MATQSKGLPLHEKTTANPGSVAGKGLGWVPGGLLQQNTIPATNRLPLYLLAGEAWGLLAPQSLTASGGPACCPTHLPLPCTSPHKHVLLFTRRPLSPLHTFLTSPKLPSSSLHNLSTPLFLLLLLLLCISQRSVLFFHRGRKMRLPEYVKV